MGLVNEGYTAGGSPWAAFAGFYCGCAKHFAAFTATRHGQGVGAFAVGLIVFGRSVSWYTGWRAASGERVFQPNSPQCHGEELEQDGQDRQDARKKLTGIEG